MPIPDFTEYGILPEGHFNATKAEISDRYLTNPNRAEIWSKFEEFILEVQGQQWAATVQAYLLDGGFTSDKQTTKDIDVVLDLSTADDISLYEACFWLNTHRERFTTDYQVDVYPYHPKIPNDLRAYFAYVKVDERIQRGAPIDTRKGLLIYKP